MSSNKHLFSIKDLSKKEIESILDAAARIKKQGGDSFLPAGYITGLCFFQPSTRTRIGFDAAVKRLGGATWSLNESREVQRAPHGESLEDTIRCISAYSDLLVVRHESSEVFKKLIQVARVPVINAGSGNEHHPTQTLIDLFHIKEKLGCLENLRIGLVGDLQTSRAARSLVQAFKYWCPAEIRMMAPKGRWLTKDEIDGTENTEIKRSSELLCDGLDVLYVAGLPNPKAKPAYSLDLRKALEVNKKKLARLHNDAILMCPLPRIDEIDVSVDQLKQATYFEQSDDGIWVRMAVIKWLIDKLQRRGNV